MHFRHKFSASFLSLKVNTSERKLIRILRFVDIMLRKYGKTMNTSRKSKKNGTSLALSSKDRITEKWDVKYLNKIRSSIRPPNKYVIYKKHKTDKIGIAKKKDEP